MSSAEAASKLLDGKVAIVTGAGQGIGRAIAIAVARAGASVVVNDIDEPAATKVVNEIAEFGGRAITCPIGIGTEEAAEAIVRTTKAEFGSVDLLVNNAGIGGDRPLLDISEEQVHRSMAVNLIGPLLLAKHVCRELTAQRYGKVVNMTSRSGLRGKSSEPAYSAAKAGIVGLTLTMSIEMAPYGVNVNAVAPAAWTALLENMPEPERTQTIEKRTSNVLNRVAQPSDVAPLVVFLLSDQAEYVTGQVVEATGQQASLL